MSVIKNTLLFTGQLGEKLMNASFDGAITQSCISAGLLNGLSLPHRLTRKRKITLGNVNSFEPECCTSLDFYINEVLLSDEFFILPALCASQTIIGATTLRKRRIRLHSGNNTIWVHPDAEKLKLI